MFERWFTIDPDKPDAEGLPKPETRKRQYRQNKRVYRTRMILPNLWCFLFYLPALIWTGMTLRSAPLSDTAGFNEGAYLGAYFAGLFVCVLITGPAMAGMTLLMRNWARGEHCFRGQTFFGGMKRNWKQGLMASALTGLMPLMIYGTLSYYGGRSGESLLWLIPFGLAAVLSIVGLMMLKTLYTLIVTYDLPFRLQLKNALLLAFGYFLRSLWAVLRSLFPIMIFLGLLLLFPTALGAVLLLAAGYYGLIGIADERFDAAAFANELCEAHINAKIPGARVDIGLKSERETPFPEAPAPLRQEEAAMGRQVEEAGEPAAGAEEDQDNSRR